MTEKKKKLMIQASEIREKTVELIYHGGGGHIGGDLVRDRRDGCSF